MIKIKTKDYIGYRLKTSMGHSTRRSEIDIIAEILRIAMKGERKTRIMYKANLNHSNLKKYLNLLIGKGLIIKIRSNGVELFKTTKKGYEFLMSYEYLYKYIR